MAAGTTKAQEPAEPAGPKKLKVISKFPLYRLGLRSSKSTLIDKGNGKLEKVVISEGSHAQFVDHVAMIDEEWLPHMKQDKEYGKDYMLYDEWRKMRKGTEDEKAQARNFARDLVRYASQKEFLTEGQKEDLLDKVFERVV